MGSELLRLYSNSVLTLCGLILAPILNLFKLRFWVLGYRTIIARYVAKRGIATDMPV